MLPAFSWRGRVVRSLVLGRGMVAPTRNDDAGPSLLSASLPPHMRNLRPIAAIISTPIRTRSIVVCLADEGGRMVAVAKAGFRPEADASIRRQINALGSSEVRGKAPELLGAFEIEGRPAFVTSYVEGKPGSTSMAGIDEALSLQLDAREQAPRWSAVEHPWLRRVCIAADLNHEEIAADLPGTWPEVRIHGDLAPWNIVRERDGNVLAIDWGASEPDALPGVDLALYAAISARSFRSSTPSHAGTIAVQALVSRLGFTPVSARAIVLLAAASRSPFEYNYDGARFWGDVAAALLHEGREPAEDVQAT